MTDLYLSYRYHCHHRDIHEQSDLARWSKTNIESMAWYNISSTYLITFVANTWSWTHFWYSSDVCTWLLNLKKRKTSMNHSMYRYQITGSISDMLLTLTRQRLEIERVQTRKQKFVVIYGEKIYWTCYSTRFVDEKEHKTNTTKTTWKHGQ
jgi:hypothetical protein